MSQHLHLKAKSRGSWSNVASFDSDSIDDIQAASKTICAASGYTVSFKIADDHGVTLSSLDARNQPIVWAKRVAT